MRNYPYVVVTSGLPSEPDFLLKALDKLKIPYFFAARDVQPGENSVERLRSELNAADVVLVVPGPQEMFSKDAESEAVESRKSTDPAFKVIPVLTSLEVTHRVPDWLKGVKPLFYDQNDPSGAIVSVVKTLLPDIETRAEVTLDELLAEAEALKLRLEFIEDQYRHSLILLGVSALVFAAGFFTVIYAVRSGAGNPLSGFYQFFGLVLLVVGGISLFFSSLNWSSQYRRSRLAGPLIKLGSNVISQTKDFLKVEHKEQGVYSPSS